MSSKEMSQETIDYQEALLLQSMCEAFQNAQPAAEQPNSLWYDWKDEMRAVLRMLRERGNHVA